MGKLCAALMFLVVLIGIYGIYNNSVNSNYCGKVIFTSEQEYSKFKQTLIDTNANWNSNGMSVLSSAPPIIVDFDVKVPSNEKFPYGNRDEVGLYGFIFISIFGLGAGISVLMLKD
jgi:hypothetical protein